MRDLLPLTTAFCQDGKGWHQSRSGYKAARSPRAATRGAIQSNPDISLRALRQSPRTHGSCFRERSTFLFTRAKSSKKELLPLLAQITKWQTAPDHRGGRWGRSPANLNRQEQHVGGGREVPHKGKPSAVTARVESRARTRRRDIAQERFPSGIANNPDQDTKK
jgi:hypothetical protein